MTTEQMHERLTRVRAWMTVRLTKHPDTKARRLADIDAVLVGLRAQCYCRHDGEPCRVPAEDTEAPRHDP